MFLVTEILTAEWYGSRNGSYCSNWLELHIGFRAPLAIGWNLKTEEKRLNMFELGIWFTPDFVVRIMKLDQGAVNPMPNSNLLLHFSSVTTRIRLATFLSRN